MPDARICSFGSATAAISAPSSSVMLRMCSCPIMPVPMIPYLTLMSSYLQNRKVHGRRRLTQERAVVAIGEGHVMFESGGDDPVEGALRAAFEADDAGRAGEGHRALQHLALRQHHPGLAEGAADAHERHRTGLQRELEQERHPAVRMDRRAGAGVGVAH